MPTHSSLPNDNALLSYLTSSQPYPYGTVKGNPYHRMFIFTVSIQDPGSGE